MSAPDFASRMTRAAAQAADAGLTGLLVTPGPDLAYLTGYAPIVTERLTLLAVQAGRDPAMLVPVIERPGAQAAPAGAAVALSDWTDGDDPYAAAAPLVDPAGRYAISDAAWAMHLLGLQEAVPEAAYVSMTSALPMLRAVKDDDELERLAAAGAAVDACVEAIARTRFAGRRESDIAADLVALLREHGHSQVDFTVVGSGPNGASPHHEVSERTIEDGDMVVLDVAVCATATAPTSPAPSTSASRPGRSARSTRSCGARSRRASRRCVAEPAARDVDRAARTVIEDAGYGEYFIHRVGHGIGVTTHEPPYMVEGETHPIEPGMCFSIEPGLYLPGRFGVRIEDIVVATQDGARRLNHAGRELRIVA